jgi:hypothetical protein
MAISDKDPSGTIRAVPLEKAGAPNNLGAGSGGDDGMDDMPQRVARLEGALDGLRHNQTITFSAVALVSAIVIAVSSYSLLKIDALGRRMDGVESRINELPAKISAELRDINNTLAQAITAAKQTPPQVIVIPSPLPPASKAP